MDLRKHLVMFVNMLSTAFSGAGLPFEGAFFSSGTFCVQFLVWFIPSVTLVTVLTTCPMLPRRPAPSMVFISSRDSSIMLLTIVFSSCPMGAFLYSAGSSSPLALIDTHVQRGMAVHEKKIERTS